MKNYQVLFFIGVLLTVVGYYLRTQDKPQGGLAQEIKLYAPVADPRSLSRQPSFLQSYSNPRAINDENIQAIKEKMHERFLTAGLSEKKSQAMFDLNDFHQSMPVFNEENIAKREEMLEKLSQDPKSTVEAFKKLMGEGTSDEEALRVFMVNITLALKIPEEDKAEIFASRIIQSASFRPDGTVEDNEMSIMIALGNLSRLEDAEVKSSALDEILGAVWPKEKKQEYLQLLRDYFPEHAEKINSHKER
jgi:hypothetical protein